MPRPAPIFEAAGALGERIRTRRTELALSQEALADRAGLHWTYLGSVERGRRNVSLLNILRIAGALDIDPGHLMAGLSATPATN